MYLLDSHILLWYLAADQRLSLAIKEIIDQQVGLNISIASLWEIIYQVQCRQITSSI